MHNENKTIRKTKTHVKKTNIWYNAATDKPRKR